MNQYRSALSRTALLMPLLLWSSPLNAAAETLTADPQALSGNIANTNQVNGESPSGNITLVTKNANNSNIANTNQVNGESPSGNITLVTKNANNSNIANTNQVNGENSTGNIANPSGRPAWPARA